ncbi:MAG: hypothetical protein U0736_09715 [Gemmataceae bacterium]
MIQMPQRSVTRFFIPMIDVLTLMFCIYLLMPMVSNPDDPESEAERRAREERLKQLEAELAGKAAAPERVPAELLAEIERLRREKVEALRNRLAVRVLEVDPKDGTLSFRDPDPVPIRDQADAVRLIERDRQQQGVAAKELYYLILYPRERTSGYPTREQRRQYDRWFSGVALGYDIPGTAPGKER